MGPWGLHALAIPSLVAMSPDDSIQSDGPGLGLGLGPGY